MAQTPEAKAREEIDRLLTAAGWLACGTEPRIVCDIHWPLMRAEWMIFTGYSTLS